MAEILVCGYDLVSEGVGVVCNQRADFVVDYWLIGSLRKKVLRIGACQSHIGEMRLRLVANECRWTETKKENALHTGNRPEGAGS